MQTRHFLFASMAALVLAASTPACAFFEATRIVPSGNKASETRSVPAFNAVSLSLPGRVDVRQGTPASVVVEADDNLLPEIETTVENARLRLRFKRALNVAGRNLIRISVTAPSFESLAISGSGDLAADELRAGRLSVAISGSGDMRLGRLEAGELGIAISGSGDFKASGRAGVLQAKIAGSGDIDTARLEARRASVSIAGSGDAVLTAKETLTVNIAGSGDVRYHGDPAVTKSVAGSGSVKRLGPAP